MYSDNTMLTKIAEMTCGYAETTRGGTDTARAVIECIVGATMPVIGSMFSGGTPQERLLFTLIMARACTTITNQDNGFGLTIDVSPETLRDAFETFTLLTDSDIRPHLPKEMLAYASKADKRSIN